MSERARDVQRLCANYAPPTYPSLPKELPVNSPSTPTSRNADRKIATVDELRELRAENARLRKSLAFFAARFLAVAPRHEGSGAER